MDIGNIAQQQTQSLMTGTAQQAVVAHGTLGGQKVSVTNPFSLIANSAEEASFAMSEREDMRLEGRKMMPKVFSKERVEQVEKYLELMEKQNKSKKLDAFVSELAGSGVKKPDQAVTLALKYFEEPTDAFAALGAAKKELSRKLGEDFFDEALAQLDDLYTTKIKTGLASGAAAVEFGELGDADTLKALYSDALDEKTTPFDTYEKILKDYGAPRVKEALAFLTRSLGNEMAATTSRTDKVLLENLSRDLGVVQQLHGLHAGCKNFGERFEKMFQKPCPLAVPQMMKQVLNLGNSSFLGAFDIENLSDNCGMVKIEDKIAFYQEFSNMARELSENLFSDADSRLNIIDATQQALDDAIAVEEEMYD